MSKRRRSRRRKSKTARPPAKKPLAASKSGWRLLAGALAVCIVGAVLVIAFGPWGGQKMREKDRKVADVRSPWPEAAGFRGREGGQTVVNDLETTDGETAPWLVPLEKPTSLTLDQESANLKNEERKLAREVGAEFPNSVGYYMLAGDMNARHGDSGKAMELWEKGLEIDPRRADIYARMGYVALENEEQENAILYWRKALEIQPDNAALRGEVAKALIQLGKYKEVIAELDKDPEATLHSPDAHLMLGEANFYLKQFDEAKRHYEAAVQLKPNYTHAYHGLYTVCTRLKQPEKAREYLDKFEELKAKDYETKTGDRLDVRSDVARLREGLLGAYLQAEQMYLAKGRLKKAEDILRRALRLQPTNVRSLERLAVLYFQTERMPQSLNLYKYLSGIDPGNPRYHLNIGLVSSQLGLVDAAEAAFRKVIEFAPNDCAPYRELARLYLKTNRNLPAALEHAAKALHLEKAAENYFVYAWASDLNGKRTQAMTAIEKAVQMEPGNQTYRRAYLLIKSRK